MDNTKVEVTLPEYLKAITESTHALVGGTTGSGKSVLLNTIINYLIAQGCNTLYLIDPKKVDLINFAGYKCIAGYASNMENILALLQNLVYKMDIEYKLMQFKRKAKNTDHPTYIIIDEFADLITMRKKEVTQLICKLIQFGRACNYHLIIATQRPTRDVISGQIKANFTCTVALHTANKQESRNLIYSDDAYYLPQNGKMIINISGLNKYSDITLDTLKELQSFCDTYRTYSKLKRFIYLFR